MRAEIDDVEIMQSLANEAPTDDTRGYEIDYLQLSPGPFRTVFETIRGSKSILSTGAGANCEKFDLPRDRHIANASLQRYGARVRIRGASPSDRSCFWCVISSSGPVRWRGMPLPPGTLIELPPSFEVELTGAGLEIATFSFRDEIRDTIFGTTGHASTEGVIPLPAASAARLSGIISEYLQRAHIDPDAREWEQELEDALAFILADPPGYLRPHVSSERRRLAVKRAEDFLLENMDRPIPAHELASVAAIPLRTLQDAFRREFGVSPHAFHARLRMRGARRRLEAASETSTRVSDIAMQFGFWHLGRFAVDYKRLFGESPIETLRGGCSTMSR